MSELCTVERCSTHCWKDLLFKDLVHVPFGVDHVPHWQDAKLHKYVVEVSQMLGKQIEMLQQVVQKQVFGIGASSLMSEHLTHASPKIEGRKNMPSGTSCEPVAALEPSHLNGDHNNS
eukprot:739548-Amphidinium_carterae.1